MKEAEICANLIQENKEYIISQWEKEVREKISGAGTADSPALRNELPYLLDDIADILATEPELLFTHQIDEYVQTIEKNVNHGKTRAKLEHYSSGQVIQEYLILHKIITEFLESHNTLNVPVVNLIKYIMETTMMRSIESFTDSMNRMQEQLVGTLAHDIRNPLSTALSALELLSLGTSEKEKCMDLASRSINRSLKMIEMMLHAISAKSGEGMMMDFQQGDYVQVLTDVCEEVGKTYTQEIRCAFPDGTVNAIMDPLAVRRLIDNLISNAVKYGDSSYPVKVSLTEVDNEVLIEVNNQGEPIPADEQKSIFSFLNTDTKRPSVSNNTNHSWGMGLTLVKMVVDAHKGSVELSSDREKGTSFFIRLKKFPGNSGKIRVKA